MANILASKLYIGSDSTRKKRILSAVADPVNKELVEQVRDYLDEEFINPLYLNSESHDVEDTGASEGSPSMSKDTKGFGSPSGAHPSFSGGPSTAGLGDDSIPDDADTVPEGEEAGSEETSDIKEDSAEEPSDVDSSTDINISVAEVQGTLNSREDCAGVTRVVIKDSELWVYYKDDVNLNKTMTATIEKLLEAGYHSLEFNRLARSNNAVVFDILTQTIDNNASGGE